MGNERLWTALKAAALIKLVESGIIQREENGDVDTEAFEIFWSRFERDVDTAFSDQIAVFRAELSKISEEEREKDGDEGRKETDGSTYRSTSDRIFSGLDAGFLKFLCVLMGGLLLLAVLR